MPDIPQLGSIWVYLAASPLLGLTLTLCAYVCAYWIYRRCGFSPFANPVAIAIAIVGAILLATGMSYQDYFSGAQFVHFLLGPATVALAIPLARQLPRLRRSFLPLFCGLFSGSLTAILSAVTITVLMGGSLQLAASIGPKSATTPIAMGVSEKLGGLPALTAILVIATGIFGAVIARQLFNWLRIDSPAVRGFALGVTSHGIGTARAFQVSPEAGAFAALGMGLNGILTAFLAPSLIPIVLGFLPR
ncbi:MAG: LrgB family protein [Pseudomonadota bacterium]